MATCPKWWPERSWRAPDEDVEHATGYDAIWYGPGDTHEAIEHALYVQYDGFRWTISDYQDARGLIEDAPDRFLVTSTTFLKSDLEDLLRACGEKVPEDLSRLARKVAAIGTAYMDYYGGDEDWESEIPDLAAIYGWRIRVK